MKPTFTIAVSILLFLSSSLSSFAMICVGDLSKEEALELGITMKQRTNGDAGVLVWIEFKKENFLKDFSYCKLQMNDTEGKHLLSAILQQRAVVHGQPEEIASYAFSAEPEQLKHCSFLVVAYGSSRGDVGYNLHVKDYIETE